MAAAGELLGFDGMTAGTVTRRNHRGDTLAVVLVTVGVVHLGAMAIDTSNAVAGMNAPSPRPNDARVVLGVACHALLRVGRRGHIR